MSTFRNNLIRGGYVPPFFVPLGWIVVAFFLLLHTSTSTAEPEQASASSEYRLDAGDLIQIQVRDEPDLSLELRIDQKGYFSYPFLGQVQASGMTVDQLEKRITSGLKGDYLVDPDVLVYVDEYRQIYVNGQVTRPGGYAYVPGLTVEKAVALAGGLTERASRKRIYLKREKDPEQNLYSVEMTNTIQPGDTIIVEESFF